jgi:hypothetical protein
MTVVLFQRPAPGLEPHLRISRIIPQIFEVRANACSPHEVDREQGIAISKYDGSLRQVIDRTEQLTFPPRVYLGATGPEQAFVYVGYTEAPSGYQVPGNPQSLTSADYSHLVRFQENSVGGVQTLMLTADISLITKGQLVTCGT